MRLSAAAARPCRAPARPARRWAPWRASHPGARKTPRGLCAASAPPARWPLPHPWRTGPPPAPTAGGPRGGSRWSGFGVAVLLSSRGRRLERAAPGAEEARSSPRCTLSNGRSASAASSRREAGRGPCRCPGPGRANGSLPLTLLDRHQTKAGTSGTAPAVAAGRPPDCGPGCQSTASAAPCQHGNPRSNTRAATGRPATGLAARARRAAGALQWHCVPGAARRAARHPLHHPVRGAGYFPGTLLAQSPARPCQSVNCARGASRAGRGNVGRAVPRRPRCRRPARWQRA
mmetsp:Transcript_112540/g.313073  ORF Transcript_112540/g.313073 Transcript_112540/m.313073 type:complete len:289 (+) Transcript_112540:674-1540(+)